MDVHRARFVPYPTSAISALAFSRSSDNGYTGPLPALKLAVGRANGSIEIWNPLKGSWVREAVFAGDGRSIDGLAWTQDPDEKDTEDRVITGQQRLFSIASSPTVTEWDLSTGLPKRRSTGNFSEVWCFAAQQRWRPQKSTEEEPRSQDIVAGCGDGTLVLLTTTDNDLQFKRFLARVSGKKARCMCITYQNRDIVVAGFADSMLRVYDTRNGSQLRQMSLGVGLPGAPKNALVWQVKALPNGDIVSGDSNGEVRVWDGKNYSLLRRLTGHETDCLDLITSTDGKTIFSGSIDGRVAVYKQSNNDGSRTSWGKTSHRRVHSGEVKAMAVFDSKALSVVVSGGSDVSPVVMPLREYGKENLRFLSSLPQEAPVASAPKARLLVSWWEKDVYIYRIARLSAVDATPQPEKPRKLVAKLSLTTKDNIRSVSISSDGRLIAASTSTEIKLFQLKKRIDTDSLAVRKLETPTDFAALGARLLSFAPDGKWLAAVTPDSEVHMARFSTDDEQPKRIICLPETVELDRRHRNTTQSAYMEYERAISRLAWADDSAILVTGDLAGYLDSWVLEGHEDITAPAVDKTKHDSDKGSSGADSDSGSDDSDDDDAMVVYFGQHWTDNPAGHLLPKLDSAPLVMTFRPQERSQPSVNGNPGVHATRHNPHAHSHELPSGPRMLWVMTARHQMYEFDVLAGKLSGWSRRNPTAALPEHFTKIKDRVVGSVWDDRRERLWLYGSSWVFMLDVKQDLADGGALQLAKKRRRRRGDEGDDGAAKRQKGSSGAGDRVRASQDSGTATRYENGKAINLDLSSQPRRRNELVEDDGEDDDTGLQLTRLRSSSDEAQAVDSGEWVNEERRWWCTFKYRPILGMMPLEDESATDPDGGIEVAIVERPIRSGT
ncbi:hypothetical protein LTR36_001389 [Oleoguttula mirabilis]|uniref:WD40 repeat-like protein n=1 Tax=Oleoguttula mirabilis TaxID=1507867 RepID=A0AAV9JNN2_9PEZI|nr:hypothetical protein LTR36_001389 [Oleoguttula mirabilis]